MPRGRKPSVRYWASRKGGGYFCSMNGRQVELALGPDDAPNGPTYLKALKQFVKLQTLETNKGTDDYLVSALFNRYRAFLQDKHPRRLHLFEAWSHSFSELYGNLRVRDLRPFHMSEWLAKQPTWNDTSKWNAGTKVMAAINWAAKEGYIESNPLWKRITLPRPLTRGKEARLPAELCDLLIASAYSPVFGLFLRTLRETGARPVEIRMATAENYVGGRLVFPWNTRFGYRHKTAAKTRKDRIIYLTSSLQAEVERLVKQRPEGRLFLTPRGKEYTTNNLYRLWQKILKRGPVATYLKDHEIDPYDVTPYSFRHTFISEWVETGRSLKVCAEICGTSVAMIERVYGHADMEKIHEHYLNFMQSRPAG